VTDRVAEKTRSRMMSGIRGKNTKPELMVRRGLHLRGYRFRLHRKDLPGAPDLTLTRWRAVIFVHGCFWHQHPGCRFAATPSTNVEWWQQKFVANRRRDEAALLQAKREGWRTLVVWECATRSDPDHLIELVVRWLRDLSATQGEISGQAASSAELRVG
jgi:DNA mismatch endonuclease (patch repair protein)